MSTAIATTPAVNGALMEQVLLKGDLESMSPPDRVKYYNAVCDSLGLNPLTRPFEYIRLNNKLTLYARKDCTDQLRSIHNVSVTDLSESERDGVFIVTAKVANDKGRTDASKGAVHIGGLKADALANAIMKAETKAKRRATLSICGLGFLDELEIETVPRVEVNGDEPPVRDEKFLAALAKWDKSIKAAQTVAEVNSCWSAALKQKDSPFKEAVLGLFTDFADANPHLVTKDVPNNCWVAVEVPQEPPDTDLRCDELAQRIEMAGKDELPPILDDIDKACTAGEITAAQMVALREKCSTQQKLTSKRK